MVIHSATCSVLIGGLLRHRVTGWHQVAMGKQGTSTNETNKKKRGECEERERERQTNRDNLRLMLQRKKKKPEKETMKESNRRRE